MKNKKFIYKKFKKLKATKKLSGDQSQRSRQGSLVTTRLADE